MAFVGTLRLVYLYSIYACTTWVKYAQHTGNMHIYDTGYPHDGRADNAAYWHDRRADKRRYPHDREIDI